MLLKVKYIEDNTNSIADINLFLGILMLDVQPSFADTVNC